MTRLIRCTSCDRMHPASVPCAVCRARVRVTERLALAVGKAAYARLAMLIDAAPGTPEGVELNALADIISGVEARNFPS